MIVAVYKPVYTQDALDLRCALKARETVIVSNSRELFAKMDKAVSKSKTGRVCGNVAMGLGAAAYFFLSAGIGLAFISGAALAKYLTDALRDYDYVIDYTEKRVILLRKHGANKFRANIDSIEGIDLNAIAVRGN